MDITLDTYIRTRERGAALVRRVREARAEGVILAAPSFCDPALLERPSLSEALRRAGIPYTPSPITPSSRISHWRCVNWLAPSATPSAFGRRRNEVTAVSGLKSASRERRNQMLGDYLDRLEGAAASGRKVVYRYPM